MANPIQEIINKPHNDDFVTGLILESAHQVEKWGEPHDRAKEPEDWMWLMGWLVGKAAMAHRTGDREKAKHHCISSAAVLLQWHALLSGHGNGFTPGASDLQQHLEKVLGVDLGEPEASIPAPPPDGTNWQDMVTAPVDEPIMIFFKNYGPIAARRRLAKWECIETGLAVQDVALGWRELTIQEIGAEAAKIQP